MGTVLQPAVLYKGMAVPTKINIKFPASYQSFSYMASQWLAAKFPACHKLDVKILVYRFAF